VFTELPGTFTKEKTITRAEVVSGCHRLIRCGVELYPSMYIVIKNARKIMYSNSIHCI